MDLAGWRRALPALALVGLLAGACSSSDDDGAGASDGGAARPARVTEDFGGRGGGAEGRTSAANAVTESGAEGEAQALTDTAGSEAQRDPLSVGPHVIKTANIELEIPRKDFRTSVQDAIDVAQANGGFVLSTEIHGDERMSGIVVLRVPAESFESALGTLKDLGETTGETVSGRDVSEEFVDLSARLRNFEAQERVLLRLMNRAQTVGATIRVQRELSQVQLEIERLRGRLRFLEVQTDIGTIRMDLVQAGAPRPGPKGTLERAWERAVETATAVVSGIVIGAGFVVPIAVLLGLVALAVRFARPRFSGSP